MTSQKEFRSSYSYKEYGYVLLVSLDDIEEPIRSEGVKKYRSQDHYEQIKGAMLYGDFLPPIDVVRKIGSKKFAVYDGFHRFHISKELGFSKIPVRVVEIDLDELI